MGKIINNLTMNKVSLQLNKSQWKSKWNINCLTNVCLNLKERIKSQHDYMLCSSDKGYFNITAKLCEIITSTKQLLIYLWVHLKKF